MWYLYSAPLPTPGTKPSQIPELARARSGCDCVSQPLKSPTTETELAFGAQTPKTGARLSRDRGDVGAQLVVNPVVRAFVKEMKVLFGQQAGIAALGWRSTWMWFPCSSLSSLLLVYRSFGCEMPHLCVLCGILCDLCG